MHSAPSSPRISSFNEARNVKKTKTQGAVGDEKLKPKSSNEENKSQRRVGGRVRGLTLRARRMSMGSFKSFTTRNVASSSKSKVSASSSNIVSTSTGVESIQIKLLGINNSSNKKKDKNWHKELHYVMKHGPTQVFLRAPDLSPNGLIIKPEEHVFKISKNEAVIHIDIYDHKQTLLQQIVNPMRGTQGEKTLFGSSCIMIDEFEEAETTHTFQLGEAKQNLSVTVAASRKVPPIERSYSHLAKSGVSKTTLNPSKDKKGFLSYNYNDIYYKEFWSVLENGILSLYANRVDEGDEPVHSFNCLFINNPIEKCDLGYRFSFKVPTVDGAHIFYAESTQEMESWMTCLSS